MSNPQNYANHARRDPKFLFFFPILLINFVYRLVQIVHHPDLRHLWTAIVALAVLSLAMTVRIYAIRVQDRVIRMEERIRIAAVASPVTLARMDEFTIPQLVALRFAPWAELGPLADRALAEKLTAKQIKQTVVQWRPDNYRV